MAELDPEKLKRKVHVMTTLANPLARAGSRLTVTEWRYIDAALEDRDRLRKAARIACLLFDNAGDGTKQSLDFDEAMNELRAALEGRDGGEVGHNSTE